MRDTTKPEARLATRHNLGSGYRAPALYERLTQGRTRHAAHETLCRAASAKPQWLRDHRSKAATHTLPDERLHTAIMDGIRAGYITPDVLADFYGECFALYRAMMPGAAEATYLDTTREKAEAMEALAIARTQPSAENVQYAIREVLEDVIVSTAHAKRLQGGSAA
jgi:hypothetical protein